MYLSDYNYRIEDYKADVINGKQTDQNDDEAIEGMETDLNKELRVFITYKVILKNNSAHNGVKVNELAYYYDQHYKIDSITDIYGNSLSYITKNSEIDGKDAIIVTLGENARDLGNQRVQNDKESIYRQELYFKQVFRVAKKAEIINFNII